MPYKITENWLVFIDGEYETYFPLAKCFPIVIGPEYVEFRIPVMGIKVVKNRDMYPSEYVFRNALRTSILNSSR